MPRQAPRARLVSGNAARPWGMTAKQANEGHKEGGAKSPKRLALQINSTRATPDEPCAVCKKPIGAGKASWALNGSGRAGATHSDCSIRWGDDKRGAQVFAPTKAPALVLQHLELKRPPPNWAGMRPDQRWLLMVAAHRKLGVRTASRLLRTSSENAEGYSRSFKPFCCSRHCRRAGPYPHGTCSARG